MINFKNLVPGRIYLADFEENVEPGRANLQGKATR